VPLGSTRPNPAPLTAYVEAVDTIVACSAFTRLLASAYDVERDWQLEIPRSKRGEAVDRCGASFQEQGSAARPGRMPTIPGMTQFFFPISRILIINNLASTPGVTSPSSSSSSCQGLYVATL
jgi:hypothetical protein